MNIEDKYQSSGYLSSNKRNQTEKYLLTMELNKKQIFIIGAQRSGTTLLRLILNAHSQIAVSGEAEFLMSFLKRKYLNHRISGSLLKTFFNDCVSLKSSYASFAGFFSQLTQREKLTLRDLVDDMFSSYCRSEGKYIWGNKTTSFFRKIDILFDLFPDAKFIHIVRDGRDVFDSRRKMNPVDSNAAVAALDWDYNLYKVEKSFRKILPNNKITIHYEDLLDDPETTIKSVCSLIGVEYEANMLGFYKTSSHYTASQHSELIFKPLNKNNKYKWRKNLTYREVKIFDLLARHYLRKYNYEIENNLPGFSDILFMFKGLFIDLPHKLIRIVSINNVFKKAVGRGRFRFGKKSDD